MSKNHDEAHIWFSYRNLYCPIKIRLQYKPWMRNYLFIDGFKNNLISYNLAIQLDPQNDISMV